ncbi:MAG: hypothetical protein HC942_01105 [Microcoleus sp. SU_5_6]|nr:hypothetical protein [Microcoleus sp. SU_5_6]
MTAASRIAISLSPKSDRALQSPAYLQNRGFQLVYFCCATLKEEGRRKREEGRRKREEGRGKKEEGRGTNILVVFDKRKYRSHPKFT